MYQQHNRGASFTVLCGVVTVLLLSLVVLLTPGSGLLNAQNLGCATHAFKCCRNVRYPVMAMLVDTFDQTTCKTIDIIFRGQLQNATQACKQAYVEAYCLSAIPQCCSNQPVVFHVCASVCRNLLNTCGHNVNFTSCDSAPFYPPPCNSGSGVSCAQSYKILGDNQELEP